MPKFTKRITLNFKLEGMSKAEFLDALRAAGAPPAVPPSVIPPKPAGEMRIIELDASNCATVLEFMDALCAVLSSPEGHGRSVDAFIDSMIWGGMNSVVPPYTIRVSGTEKISKDVRDEIELLRRCLTEAREEFRVRKGYDVDVTFEVHP